ncbi:MAG TPA: ABC transporter permease [bacterium]|uniref:Dipeptide transport system permease protein DppC n=1 Tax=candidate division TA06 bacterium ADurb.Bin417 TaxID=1852828 RepID=A0A1V5MJX6_UNCT6|nr:MAG: Dipeptide transport system permease protein DppC [candidate division TA06 bacterium ADurb.Bin417]HNQ34932.1 ABC transporter permease [bacterium]HNS49150.1 ABC transporter permease [bacterium]
MKDLLTRLRRERPAAFFSFWVLVLFYAAALLADLLAPYPYDFQTREKPYSPPTPIRFREANGGRWHLRPFIYDQVPPEGAAIAYRADASKPYFIRLFPAGPERKIFGFLPCRRYLLGVPEPARLYLLGSDQFGRDLFSRILHGGRVSLSIGLVGVTISFLLGLLFGGLAGYYGGRVDNLLMRVAELLMSFPGFYLILALRAVFPTTLSSYQVYLMVVAILALIGWAGLARVVRGMVLSIREEDYILAARALGFSNRRIIWNHVLPQTFSYTITAVSLSIPGYILGESALSILGLGIQEPQASWGNILASAMGNLEVILYHAWMLLPGLLIFVTVLAYNLLGDGLRELVGPSPD